MSSFVAVLIAIVGLSFWAVIGVAALTYIRRTWQLMQAEGEGSPQERLEDGLNQIQLHLHLLAERMERLERRLGPGTAASADGGGGDDGDGEGERSDR